MQRHHRDSCFLAVGTQGKRRRLQMFLLRAFQNDVFHIQKEPVFVLGITDEVQIFRAAHLDPFYGVAVLLSSEVPRFQDTFLHF